jgi:putative transposase
LADDAAVGEDGSPLRMTPPHGPPSGSVGAIIGQFKSRLTKRLHLPVPFWQRNYYEHILRDPSELERVRRYILENPLHWAGDAESPHLAPHP